MRNVLGYGPIPEAVTLTNNSIVNADINASAAIAASKLNLATIEQDIAIADPANPTRTLQIIHDSGIAQLTSTYGALQLTSEGSNYLQLNSDIKQLNRANNGATVTLPFIITKEIAISSASAQGGGTLIWSAANQFLLQRVVVRVKALSLGTTAALHISIGKTQKSAADAALSGDEIVYLKDNTASSAPVTFGAAAAEEGAVLNSDDFEFVVANANFYFNWRNQGITGGTTTATIMVYLIGSLLKRKSMTTFTKDTLSAISLSVVTIGHSGCNVVVDGTNDASQIQSAINTIHSLGGGNIVFAPMTFIITTPILLYSDVRLYGSGRDITILYLKSGSNCNVINTGLQSNVGIYDLTIDGNGTNQTGGLGISTADFLTVGAGTTTNIQVQNVKLTDIYSTAIQTVGDQIIIDNVFIDTVLTDVGIGGNTATKVKVLNSIITGTYGSAFQVCGDGATNSFNYDVVYDNCLAYSCGTTGSPASGFDMTQVKRGVCNNCIAYLNYGAGFNIEYNAEKIIFNDCICDQNLYGGHAGGGNFNLGGVIKKEIVLNNCIIVNGESSGSFKSGLFVGQGGGGSAQDVVINNCLIRDNTGDGLYQQHAITMNGGFIANPAYKGIAQTAGQCNGTIIDGVTFTGITEGSSQCIQISSDDVRVTNCNFKTCTGQFGILADQYNYLQITNNQFNDVNTPLRVTRSIGSQIDGNSFHDCDYNTVGLAGDTFCSVSNNTIINCANQANDVSANIFIESYSTTHSLRNRINGNTIYTSTANKPKFGIREDTADQNYNVYLGNVATNAATTNISVQGANSDASHNIN